MSCHIKRTSTHTQYVLIVIFLVYCGVCSKLSKSRLHWRSGHFI